MEVEIKKFRCLPCSLEVFTINGIGASVDDFGESWTQGDCSRGECTSTFKHGYPTQEVLDKYKITLEEFKEVCEKLEEALEVWGCGWCW